MEFHADPALNWILSSFSAPQTQHTPDLFTGRHTMSSQSQILTPPDLLALAGLESLSSRHKDNSPPPQPSIDSISNGPVLDLMRLKYGPPAPQSIDLNSTREGAASNKPPSLKKTSRKASRKKCRPEVQRRKRGEMNERFYQLKLLAVPDADDTPAIGLGDRATNSKEAILRLAGQRINSFRQEVKDLEKQIAIAQTKKAARIARNSLDFAECFWNSSVARVLMNLDGIILDFCDNTAELLDVSSSYLRELKERKETVFNLIHPDCIPLLVSNMMILRTGQLNIVQLVDSRSVTTPHQRQAVFTMITWLSFDKQGAPLYFESLLVHSGWIPVPMGDSTGLPPSHR